jgi:hypothetical protein
MKIGGGLLLLPPYVFKSCGGTKFKVKQFWKDLIYGFFQGLYRRCFVYFLYLLLV